LEAADAARAPTRGCDESWRDVLKPTDWPLFMSSMLLTPAFWRR
jgi:hypothetical protein